MTRASIFPYIRRIRNDAKRAYAAAYFRYRASGGEPPHPGGLSYLAAQAVRMNIDEAMGESIRVEVHGPPRAS